MDVFFDFFEGAGLIIAIIFGGVLIIDILVRLCTGSVKKLVNLVMSLDDHVNLVRSEVKEIRDEVEEGLPCKNGTIPGNCTKNLRNPE